jgi:hypothetical protein
MACRDVVVDWKVGKGQASGEDQNGGASFRRGPEWGSKLSKLKEGHMPPPFLKAEFLSWQEKMFG